jgi:hypothetical protein
MVGVAVEISGSMGGFLVDFGGKCCLFPHGENIEKGTHTV